ncbi:MAG: tRNA threonylcarbamoyladenosine dehydratase, partial [Pseudomonadales bacterium]
MIDLQHRFGGMQRLYGVDAFATIAQANICVVGIGGVGSWVAEALARSGVGKLTLIDMDDVSETNINRQLVALESTLEVAKVEVMADRIKDINPACECTLVEDFIGSHNLDEYLDKGFDYVIDACDSIKAKAALINWCKRHKLPVLTIGGAGGQSFERSPRTNGECLRRHRSFFLMFSSTFFSAIFSPSIGRLIIGSRLLTKQALAAER